MAVAIAVFLSSFRFATCILGRLSLISELHAWVFAVTISSSLPLVLRARNAPNYKFIFTPRPPYTLPTAPRHPSCRSQSTLFLFTEYPWLSTGFVCRFLWLGCIAQQLFRSFYYIVAFSSCKHMRAGLSLSEEYCFGLKVRPRFRRQ